MQIQADYECSQRHTILLNVLLHSIKYEIRLLFSGSERNAVLPHVETLRFQHPKSFCLNIFEKYIHFLFFASFLFLLASFLLLFCFFSLLFCFFSLLFCFFSVSSRFFSVSFLLFHASFLFLLASFLLLFCFFSLLYPNSLKYMIAILVYYA